MNKILKYLSVCIVLLSLILTACDPIPYYFNEDELQEEVVIIELIKYDYPETKEVKKKSDILPFDFDKVKILETLKAEEFNDFLNELSQKRFHVSDDITKYSNSADGVSLKIEYKNGNFLILCWNSKSNFVVEYTSDGNVTDTILRFTAAQDFIDLVNNSFQTQLIFFR